MAANVVVAPAIRHRGGLAGEVVVDAQGVGAPGLGGHFFVQAVAIGIRVRQLEPGLALGVGHFLEVVAQGEALAQGAAPCPRIGIDGLETGGKDGLAHRHFRRGDGGQAAALIVFVAHLPAIEIFQSGEAAILVVAESHEAAEGVLDPHQPRGQVVMEGHLVAGVLVFLDEIRHRQQGALAVEAQLVALGVEKQIARLRGGKADEAARGGLELAIFLGLEELSPATAVVILHIAVGQGPQALVVGEIPTRPQGTGTSGLVAVGTGEGKVQAPPLEEEVRGTVGELSRMEQGPGHHFAVAHGWVQGRLLARRRAHFPAHAGEG